MRPWGVGRVPTPFVVLSAAVILGGCSPSDAREAPSASHSNEARTRWVASIDSLRSAVDRLNIAAQSPHVDSVRAAFVAARLAYKRIEYVAAYYEPTTVKLMNGPALPRVEDDEGPEAIFPAEGFQVIEEMLFPELDTTRLDRLSAEAGNLIALAARLRNAAAGHRPTDAHVWESVRLELARIVTLGISGFDSPVAEQSLPEAAAALRGIRDALHAYDSVLARVAPADARALDSGFAGAIAALDSGDFASFDRFGFIVNHANPLARTIDRARRALGIELPAEPRAFSPNAATIFDANAFDAQAFRSPYADPDSPAKAALGRRLFFDPVLSRDAKRSCASCHQPSLAFTDGRVRSASLVVGASLRNAPTIINAGLQVGAFADLRTTYIEDQVAEVVRNRDEMHGSLETAATSVGRDSGYRASFTSAFPTHRERAVSAANIRSAIAAYVRSLTALNAPFDRAVRGDTTAMSAAARLGFNVFMGKARCGTCHFAPLFNGTAPPSYQDTDVEVLGVPATPNGTRVDPDSGRFRITRAWPHLHAFKTSTLRNVALTAPYMHNGVFRTLEEVVDFYDKGGGAGLGIALRNQTLPPSPLRLTTTEKSALVEFMRALTDTAGTGDR